MFRRLRTAIAICVAAAACTTPPEFLPPPFGPEGPSPTRLFFPNGLATLPDGSLLVTNANGNHAFDGSSMVSIRKSYLDSFFAKGLSCDTAAPVPACDDDVSTHPNDVFGGAVILGNYAGPIALNDTGTMAFSGARDTNILDAVTVNPDLTLACAPGAGTTPDCRHGLIDLTPSGVLGPYSLVTGDTALPGEAPRRALFVAALIPHITNITGGIIHSDAKVGALDLANPSTLLYTMTSGSEFLADVTPGQGAAVGPMIFDPSRRQLIMSGCFQRVGGTGAGEPGTSQCSGISFNLLRFLDVDAQAAAQVQLVDLYRDVQSIETSALLLADPDPATGLLTTLWVAVRSPDILARVELPLTPSVQPRVRLMVPLPIAPADIARIPRPGKPDLLAITGEKNGALAIFDTGTQSVVAQVERLGDSPFTVRLLSAGATSAQLAASVFKSCSVALVEVPFDEPWNAALRGRVGKCP